MKELKPIQKDDVILLGGLGTVRVGDKTHEIVQQFSGNDGHTTLTIQPTIIDEMKPLKDYLQGKSSTTKFIDECRNIQKTESAEFEIIDPPGDN